MRLAEFIVQDVENILEVWDAFAASQAPAATRMDTAAAAQSALMLAAGAAGGRRMPPWN